MDTNTRLENLRSEFPLLASMPELAYLDSAATSQKPAAVLAAITDFYTTSNANVHRGLYPLSEKSTAMYESARETVAKFIGAKPNNVIFTSGSTHSANQAALLLKKYLQPGDIILSWVADHHSEFLPLQRIASESGAIQKLLEVTTDGNLDYEQLAIELKSSQVKILALPSINNVLGTQTDLAKVSALIKEFSPNCKFMVDLAQHAGYKNLNVLELGIDIGFFSGHKMFAETGIGVLFATNEILNPLNPIFLGGGMIAGVSQNKTTFLPAPAGYEAGTPNIAGAISLAAACNYFSELGLNNISAKIAELMAYLIDNLKTVSDLAILGSQEASTHSSIASFFVQGVHPHDIADVLGQNGVAVRAGHHCNQILHREVLQIPASVRVSLHAYNTKKDIDKLIVELNKAITLLK